MRGMLTSRIARSTSLGERRFDRLGTVLRLGDDLEVGLRRRAPCCRPERTIGWSSATRIRVTSGIGISAASAGPRAGPRRRRAARLDRERAADEQRALAHAAQAAAPFDGRLGEAAPSSTTRRTTLAGARSSESTTRVAPRVAGHVRQALLGDAIDGELGLGRELRQVGGKAPLDAIPLCVVNCRESSVSALTSPRCSSISRPQLLRDPPHLLERLAHGLLRLGELAPLLGAGPRARRAGADAGQHLADLVVEAARDPQPLRLLRRERPPAALAPLDLEPLEHLVERAHELRDLGAAPLGNPLARSQQIDGPHPLDEPVERSERLPEEEEVRGDHHR